MDIIIPMAWEWTRFKWASAKNALKNFDIKWLGEIPKPYISIEWKSMIEIVLETLNISWRIIIVINSQHTEEFSQVKNVVSQIKAKFNNVLFVESGEKLKWPATTVIEAQEFIWNRELLVINSDQFFSKGFSTEFQSHIKDSNSDWTIVAYDNNSFAVLDVNWYVSTVVEKPSKMLPNSFATTWVYFWRKGSDFLDWFHQMVGNNLSVNWEFYIAPIYNANVSQWRQIDILESSQVHLVWTPKDLEYYLSGGICKSS